MKTQDIKDLMKFFEETGIGRLRIKEGDFEIEMRKKADQPEFTPDMCPTPVPQTPINLVVNNEKTQIQTPKESINSPMVGTFYVAPSPGAKPFVKPGQTVRKGEVIGIVEAMKIMNEIEAEFDCKILNILVADGQPVEYGMALVEVDKI
ncbi:acetyl-CoA carboxylase biotin carboxyl carrier protein [Campylobacter sp. FMV-PI01]|uniref:Biotin carboxyl carrier protein of acetyl-CoA carboxylase n=1 Tax=Campylobacter portucalensis TaxID=2608384 RepID=A0A6L5WI37_9BACT|nr:acetyl-CoA carboxylase biotin carboxyl carrier protein [Campylobacter portucalensis]MSN95907.1 acetyl-CoA carboxylase biotin carboxyl carrier protein [Campylobacter portucalensis]